jgi:hypothetical protein
VWWREAQMLWRRLVQQELGVADHYIERYLEALEGLRLANRDTAVLSEEPTLPSGPVERSTRKTVSRTNWVKKAVYKKMVSQSTTTIPILQDER